jgi:hypothetical protein
MRTDFGRGGPDLMRGGVPAFQLPARSTGDPANVVLEILSPGKTADIIHEGRKKLFDRKGCEAMNVGISDAIQAKDAPHDHPLGEPH